MQGSWVVHFWHRFTFESHSEASNRKIPSWFKKMHLAVSSAKWQPFCFDLDVTKWVSSFRCIHHQPWISLTDWLAIEKPIDVDRVTNSMLPAPLVVHLWYFTVTLSNELTNDTHISPVRSMQMFLWVESVNKIFSMSNCVQYPVTLYCDISKV